ncbi:MAG TPA: hypothetical protein VFT12_07540 [Thermoanaerobaculia bacterium]|nr:hypothetical protein [Thermoanaerobaculia bacterium]
MTLHDLTHELFEPLVGQKFKISADDRTFEFELVDVEVLPVRNRRRRSTSPPRRAPFSLFFVGEPLLSQSMYPVQHDALGAEPLKIFIVPVSQLAGGEGYEYEAVFT